MFVIRQMILYKAASFNITFVSFAFLTVFRTDSEKSGPLVIFCMQADERPDKEPAFKIQLKMMPTA